VGYNGAVSAPVLRAARFADLSPFEVYALCRLRVDVFVVEQECPYPELDGRDVEPATVHLWAEVDGEVTATIRVLDDGVTRAIGRVATAPSHRGAGLAARLIEEGMTLCAGFPITLGAQAHLEGWYERFGFRRSGPGYDEDGIPHVPMRREPREDPPAPRHSRARAGTLPDAGGALLAAADRLEALAARTTAGAWRVTGLLASRPEVVAVRPDGSTEHVAEARAGSGAWIAALSPAVAGPLTAVLRAAATDPAPAPELVDLARALHPSG
jgi:predicted GNAT family N-acyltransferase